MWETGDGKTFLTLREICFSCFHLAFFKILYGIEHGIAADKCGTGTGRRSAVQCSVGICHHKGNIVKICLQSIRRHSLQCRPASLPYEKVYKTLVTVGNSKNYFVFVIPIAEELDLKKAAKSVGEKSVAMIHVKDINAITGYIRGGCTAIGMKKQFVTRLDESAKSQETIIVSGGRIGSQIELKPDDLLRACKGEYADIIAK